MEYVRVHRSDLEKLKDTLVQAERHHIARDEMNAALHLGTARYSPLTSELASSKQRLVEILKVDELT